MTLSLLSLDVTVV